MEISSKAHTAQAQKLGSGTIREIAPSPQVKAPLGLKTLLRYLETVLWVVLLNSPQAMTSTASSESLSKVISAMRWVEYVLSAAKSLLA